MKHIFIFRSMVFTAFLAAVSMNALASDEKSKTKREPIYDNKADGNKQIAEASKIAIRDNKNILLQFGANWCPWCYKMHDLLQKDKEIAKKVSYEYELVLIDVDKVYGKKHNADINERFGNPGKMGLPAWVVLDAKGKFISKIYTEPFEEGDHYNKSKVLAALDKYKPEPISAEETLSSAIGRAKSESKNVFLSFSAPWCGYCKKMAHYLARDEIASVFNSAYVPVKIDVDRMTGGKELQARYVSKDQGIPFFVILDVAGKKLADSVARQGNVGFPVDPHEIEHFMKVIQANAPKLTAEKLTILEKGLKAKP